MTNESNSNVTATNRTGMGFTWVLTLVFIVLKLNPGGHLGSPVEDWSWCLAFSPLLIAWGIILAILIAVGVAFLVAFVHDEWARKKRKKEQKATQHMTPSERREYFANKRKR